MFWLVDFTIDIRIFDSRLEPKVTGQKCDHGFPVISFTSRPWSSWTANSDKKYMELNGAALNVNKPWATSRKTAFPKDK